jgi:hypothetical protein
MGLVAAIRQAFARREDPYAGGDLALARKLDGIIAAACTAVALMLLPLAPPTATLGNPLPAVRRVRGRRRSRVRMRSPGSATGARSMRR